MPHDPWTLLGWLICLVIVLIIIGAPIAAYLAVRSRRRAIADFERRRQARFAGLREGERFNLSQPGGKPRG